MRCLRLLPLLGGTLVVCGAAHAQSMDFSLPTFEQPFDVRKTWINLGFYSAHFDRHQGLEDKNPGLGFEYPLNDIYRVTAGTFHNSDRRQSHYLGLYVLPAEVYGVRLGAVMGAFDGYPNYRNGNWFPALIPTAAIEGKNWGLNVAYVPTVRNRLYGALSFQLKYRFE